MTDEPSAPATDQRAETAKRKAFRMVGWTVGILVAIVVLFVALVPAGFLDLSIWNLLKLGAGVLATILLSAGLMAASFYSDASGHDDDAPGH
ncbi:MAG: hypothetical protein HRU11_04780 [Parvularculaceae bacterium]|nr:hypothetical protein [Parvularculaceae bacterium]